MYTKSGSRSSTDSNDGNSVSNAYTSEAAGSSSGRSRSSPSATPESRSASPRLSSSSTAGWLTATARWMASLGETVMPQLITPRASTVSTGSSLPVEAPHPAAPNTTTVAAATAVFRIRRRITHRASCSHCTRADHTSLPGYGEPPPVQQGIGLGGVRPSPLRVSSGFPPDSTWPHRRGYLA